MSDDRTVRNMSCEEVSELAGLFVLGALDEEERASVVEHLATCTQAHDEIRDLGGLVPALASLAEPVDAPADLKARVIGAVAREAAGDRGRARDVARPAIEPVTIPAPPRERERAHPPARPRPPAWISWGAALAAVLVVAVVGVWAIGVQQRADLADQRARDLAAAIAALSEPGASVATIRGTGTAAGASGFAAFPAGRPGYVVMVGLPPAPQGQTYQAWYLVDGAPFSAGLMTVESDGYALLAGARPTPGTNLVALTIEPAGGSHLPTSNPLAAGEVRPSGAPPG